MAGTARARLGISASASATKEEPTEPLPPAPDVSSTFDVFTHRVVVQNDPAAGAWISLILGLLFGLAGIATTGRLTGHLLTGSFPETLFAWGALILFTGGVIGVFTAPSEYRRLVRERYGEAQRVGFVGMAFDPGYRIVGGETDAVGFIIDSRVGPPQAARLQRALRRWFEALDAEHTDRRAFDERFGNVTVLPTEEVFGPDGAGAYLCFDHHFDPDVRWRLVIPGEPRGTGDGAWDRWVVLRVRSRSGAPEPSPVQARSS